MAFAVSDEMRKRWRFHKHIAQANETTNSDYRPTGRVFVTRGIMRHHDTPNINSGKGKRGRWDEKWTWGGQPGEFMKRKPGYNTGSGVARNAENAGPVELPYVNNISIRNSLEQNGIATATVTISNQEWQEDDDGMGFIYHILHEGFFGPTLYDDDAALLGEEDSDHLGEDSLVDFASQTNTVGGKRLAGLLLPNRKLEIFQGYGDEVQRTFVGLIDRVNVTSNPPKLEITCTDFGKTLSTFSYHPRYVEKYPVAFGDKRYWKNRAKTEKVKRKHWGRRFGIPGKTILVNDLTEIAGFVLGWGGFQGYRTIRAGRIGASHRNRLAGNIKHNAVFKDEGWDKGDYFVDGINLLKELLGYVFHVTPDFDPDKPLSGRYRDPSVYNSGSSKFTVGIANFVPHNIWILDDDVEQITDRDILLNSSVAYDVQNLRKNIYITETGLKNKKKGERIMGMSSPHSLMSGIDPLTVISAKESYNVSMNELEAQVLMRMILLATTFTYAQGSFTAPGYPGARCNDQMDILDSQTGQFRRFFIAGFSSEMTLGPNATYKTTFQAQQIDNYIVRRLKDQITDLTGLGSALQIKPFIRNTSRVGR